MAMGCQQCLFHSVVKLKGLFKDRSAPLHDASVFAENSGNVKIAENPPNGVVDRFNFLVVNSTWNI